MQIVVTVRNGIHEFVSEPGEKILHAALRNGIELPYECATGTCGTCKAKLTRGRTENAWPEASGLKYCGSEGEFLTCQSVALDDCALEVGKALKLREPGTSTPRAMNGMLRRLRRLTHDVAAFDVETDTPIDFAAGQFALITVLPSGLGSGLGPELGPGRGIPGARAYSMVNFDHRAERLSFVVKKKPGGAVSEWLLGNDAEGAPVGVFAPLGHAIFHPDTERHLLCIAGGSGIAGMMSILSRACQEGHFESWDGRVFFGVRTARDVFFLDELEAFQTAFPTRLSVTIALSDEDVPASLAAAHPGLAFERGFVHEVAGQHMAGRYAGVRAYVAGPPPMVDANLRLLLQARVSPADIRYDKFS